MVKATVSHICNLHLASSFNSVNPQKVVLNFHGGPSISSLVLSAHACLCCCMLTVVHTVVQDIDHLKSLPAPALPMLPSAAPPMPPAPALRVLHPARALLVLPAPCPLYAARPRKQRRLSDLLADAATLDHTPGQPRPRYMADNLVNSSFCLYPYVPNFLSRVLKSVPKLLSFISGAHLLQVSILFSQYAIIFYFLVSFGGASPVTLWHVRASMVIFAPSLNSIFCVLAGESEPMDAAHSSPAVSLAKQAMTYTMSVAVAEAAPAPSNPRSNAIAHAATDKDMEVLGNVHTSLNEKVSRKEVPKWVDGWHLVSYKCKVAKTPLFHV
jgi:hypothetical protein